jgi:hypothetical protein
MRTKTAHVLASLSDPRVALPASRAALLDERAPPVDGDLSPGAERSARPDEPSSACRERGWLRTTQGGRCREEAKASDCGAWQAQEAASPSGCHPSLSDERAR